MTNAYKFLQYHKMITDKDYGEYADGANECHADESKGLTSVVNYY